MKVLLISVDGMRPDALPHNAKAQAIIARGAYCPDAGSVFPSVTLPCHMSMFHSVDPARHGTTINTYMPQVRPIPGLCDVLHQAKKTCAMFYNWEQLRDLARPGSLAYSQFIRGRHAGTPHSAVSTWCDSNNAVTDAAIACLREKAPDFAFLYLGWLDEAGHKYGWMTPQYFDALENSWANITRLLAALDGSYTVIITADHGGHDRDHGLDIPEDMTIPLIGLGAPFTPGTRLENLNLKDIAPTVCSLMGVEPHEDWEGRVFV